MTSPQRQRPTGQLLGALVVGEAASCACALHVEGGKLRAVARAGAVVLHTLFKELYVPVSNLGLRQRRGRGSGERRSNPGVGTDGRCRDGDCTYQERRQ